MPSARRGWAELAVATGSLLVVVTCARFSAPVASAVSPASTSTPAASAVDSTDVPGGADEPKGVEAAAVEVAGQDACGVPLAGFHRVVGAYRNGTLEGTIRILWFGDSHTAADHWPGAVRKALARVVPISGPGYLAFAAPAYRHGMAKVWQSGAIEMAPHPAARRSVEDDGVFGLGGTRLTLKDSQATVTVKPTVDGGRGELFDYELWYRTTANSDRLVITAGNERIEVRSGVEQPLSHGLSRFGFVASEDSKVEIRATTGSPQLFGLVAESKQRGLVIDTLGINGARYGTFLAWEPEAFEAAVAARKPVLAIIAYGTNEVFDEEAVSRHAQRLERIVERLRHATSDVGCLVVGPTDLSKGGEASKTRVIALDQAERETAQRLGCGYFSPYEVMVTDGGYSAWGQQEPPLALNDGVHLTARGYGRLGEELANRCLLGSLSR